MTSRRRPAVSTEHLLTSSDGFGIATATPAQRAACRILDGRPLGELAQHPDVVALVGGVDAIEALPSERGEQPLEVVFLAAIKCAKTIIALAAALRMALTVDLSRLGPGEMPRVSLVSLKLDVTTYAHRLIVEMMRASSVLRPLLLDDTADALVVRHPSGQPVELAIAAGSKAGGGLVARWSSGVIFDEAPRMNGSSDAVVNLDDARSAVLGRLLPGAQALYIGSPWAPHGPVYDWVQESWQKPTTGRVVLRGTGPQLNPSWWTPERCEQLLEADPIAYQTDVLGEFADPESGLLSPVSLRMATREGPLELAHEPLGRYSAAIDPAEGSAKGNAWTLAIVQRIDGEGGARRYRVALAREWRGLRPEQCLEQIALCCRRYGLQHAETDQYAGAANQDLARRYGLQLIVRTTTAASNLEAFTNLATLLHTDALELPPDPVLRRDLLSVKRRTTQQGVTIVLPRTGDGRHCDYAPALAAAVRGAAVATSTDDLRAVGPGPGRESHWEGRSSRRINALTDYPRRSRTN